MIFKCSCSENFQCFVLLVIEFLFFFVIILAKATNQSNRQTKHEISSYYCSRYVFEWRTLGLQRRLYYLKGKIEGFTNNVDDVFQSLQKQAYGFRNTFGNFFSSFQQRLVPDELANSHSTVRTLNFFGYS